MTLKFKAQHHLLLICEKKNALQLTQASCLTGGYLLDRLFGKQAT